ncbi:hypothetical protein L484_011098 [Morus notabilis]|uniref:Uncharacterized protein n=1 Tax=Morus notabilis TaxID=981085 RepID=W9QQ65_9ROSA|nr:hypothetical protein L484_011098 [Morus notabilis]
MAAGIGRERLESGEIGERSCNREIVGVCEIGRRCQRSSLEKFKEVWPACVSGS